jgi:hypothetical protein
MSKMTPTNSPCDLNGVIGANQNLLPILYCADAVPNASTVLNLRVGDNPMKFTDGVRCHDKNWGNKSIIDVPRYCDRSHGHLPPYSMVWYDLLDYAGNESRRFYFFKDCEVLLVDCDSDTLTVRQKGEKAAWPPTSGLKETEGISVHFTLPKNQVLAIDVATQFIV